jgi:hypothetical protein
MTGSSILLYGGRFKLIFVTRFTEFFALFPHGAQQPSTSRKTTIKQALTAFYQNPNQTTYNGLKLYKYPNGKDHRLDIEILSIRTEGTLEQAETFEEMGMKGAAQAARDSAKAVQELMTTYKHEPSQAYIDTIRALNNDLAERILQDSR